MLKLKGIVLWQNVSAPIPRLRESLCKEECSKRKVPDREENTNEPDFSQPWRTTERRQKGKSLFEKIFFSKKKTEKLTS